MFGNFWHTLIYHCLGKLEWIKINYVTIVDILIFVIFQTDLRHHQPKQKLNQKHPIFPMGVYILENIKNLLGHPPFCCGFSATTNQSGELCRNLHGRQTPLLEYTGLLRFWFSNIGTLVLYVICHLGRCSDLLIIYQMFFIPQNLLERCEAHQSLHCHIMQTCEWCKQNQFFQLLPQTAVNKAFCICFPYICHHEIGEFYEHKTICICQLFGPKTFQIRTFNSPCILKNNRSVIISN